MDAKDLFNLKEGVCMCVCVWIDLSVSNSVSDLLFCFGFFACLFLFGAENLC